MGRRRDLYQSKHPFNAYPFEALCVGSWQPVESIRISHGRMTTCTVDDQYTIEESGPFTNVRIKSRQATLSDCTCILRPGVDICVLSPSEKSDCFGELQEPGWVDARISSIERKPHESRCCCQFYVKLYTSKCPLGSEKGVLSQEIILVGIDDISILQRLDSKHFESQLYRWTYAEDCSLLQRSKLLLGRFLADISWLLVTSALKQIIFNIRSLHNKIVYEICGRDGRVSFDTDNNLRTLNFKVENEVMLPIIVQHIPTKTSEAVVAFEEHESALVPFSDVMDLRRSKRRNVQPERFLGCDVSQLNISFHTTGLYKVDKWNNIEEDEEMSLPLSELFGLRAKSSVEHAGLKKRKWSRKRKTTRDLVVHEKSFESREEKQTVGKRKDYHTESSTSSRKDYQNRLAIVPLGTESDPIALNQYHPRAKIPRNRSRVNNEDPLYYSMQSSSVEQGRGFPDLEDMEFETRWVGSPPGKKIQRKKYHQVQTKRECLTEERIYGQRTLSAGMYKDLIKSYMKSIDSTVTNNEEPLLVDQWNRLASRNHVDRRFEVEMPSPVEEVEDPELEMLWREMELSMTSSYLFEENEGSKAELCNEYVERTINRCHHENILDEEIGILCKLCGTVISEIRDISPAFLPSATWTTDHKTNNEQNPEHDQAEDEGLDIFCKNDASDPKVAEENENVWTLIPELRKKLHIHQKKAFEFLWQNVTGSLLPAQMETPGKKTGGCVISHTPGAGKTFLIIAFLVSYLKLFPGKRPLVLAPKTTLYTWHKEFVKWEIPIPVYLIHGRRSYRVFRQKSISFAGMPKPGQDVMHVLDCLEKIQKWHAHPSVLVMGYTSFLTLMREDSKFAHRKHMAKVLRESPGILILDEGHNPRSTKSRLRKVLMKVQTDLRILLSGTLFQNNFCEYFNTLCLARPKFIHEVLRVLDPKYRKKTKKKARNLLESRARKFFIDNIGNKINSSNNEERIQGLNMLRNMTSGFIDNYEAGNSDTLPGLQSYTLLMNPTDIQQHVLLKLHRIMSKYHGYPLELELLITLGSIHPWLVKTACCASKFFNREELNQLDKHKFDIKKGSKVKFVLSLVYRVFQKEKVLIFCHNIAPINLFLELFENIFGWRKGKEVMVLTGDLELFERGRVMDQFEEPGHPSRILLASITACAEGISLTAASRVILLDSEWNPSKTKQAIARAFRPGQQKMVYVYQLLAANTLEEDKYRRTTWKEWVSSMIFSEAFVEDPSCWQRNKLEDEILREMVEEDKSKSIHMIMKNEKASTN
ncbi:hypothetical protein ACJRO7_003136 [Eucalyptus globulus]|uniref:SNF2 domain-containing protein CLASSY 1-like n=1 Tax=Eucalyptus globulus TaxID=34317 RepID=A0ABD3IVE4_EUCGL